MPETRWVELGASHQLAPGIGVYAGSMITQDSSTIRIDVARPDDIEPAARLYQASAHDLFDRLRASNPWSDVTAQQEDFRQAVETLQNLVRHDDAALVIARDERGEPVGMAAVMIQSAHAHLAFLFVAPANQNQGIGRTLLDAVRKHIDARGATAITLASSRDPKAWQRYLRWGLRPAAPQLPFRAAHPIFPVHPAPNDRLAHRSISVDDVPVLAELDRPVRGIFRPDRIAFWLDDGATGSLIYERESGRPVGYALVSMNEWWGQIGPVVALEVTDFPFVLDVALVAAGKLPNPDLKPWRVDGSARNHLAVDPLLAAGFSVESLINWFETEPVGQWDRYLFRTEDEP